MRRATRRPIHPLAAWLQVTSIILLALGCASPNADAPLFEEQPVPTADHSRLYVYRFDEVRATGPAKIRIDGEVVGKLRNGEYIPIELAPGSHEISIRFRQMIWSLGWSTSKFQARPGETHFLRLSANALEQPRRAGTLEDDYRGPRSERFTLNLFRSFPAREQALPEIRASVRAN